MKELQIQAIGTGFPNLPFIALLLLTHRGCALMEMLPTLVTDRNSCPISDLL